MTVDDTTTGDLLEKMFKTALEQAKRDPQPKTFVKVEADFEGYQVEVLLTLINARPQ